MFNPLDFLRKFSPFILAGDDEITAVIDGKPFSFWTEAEITRSFDSISTFSISAPYNKDDLMFRSTFRPFHYNSVGIYVGQKFMINGNMIIPKFSKSEGTNSVTADGYARCGILEDVCADPVTCYPAMLNGLTLPLIINKLGLPYGITAFVDPLAISKVAKPFVGSDAVRIEPDEKIMPFLVKLAKQRGVYLTDDMFGNLKINVPDPGLALQSLNDDNADIQVTYNGQSIPGMLYLYGANMRGASDSNMINNDYMVRNTYRPVVFKANDTAAGGLKAAAQAELGRQIAESISITVTVPGWKDGKGLYWGAESIVNLESPANMLIRSWDYMVKKVVYKKTESGLTTTMDLCFKECYSGGLLTDFPWLENGITRALGLMESIKNLANII